MTQVAIDEVSNHSDEKNLYDKSLAGFVIFLVVGFTVLMISLYA